MQIITDLHLHSRYSRAVSQKMNLEENALWAAKKGIHLLTAADWTHPLWFNEISANLKEINDGVYSLKNKPEELKEDVRFILSTEIANIYSQGGKGRRVHNLLFAPSLSDAEKLNKELKKRGLNLTSDGRPMVGLSSKELLEIALNVNQKFILVPAHAWTPWYGIFGSMSGFDSLEEAFGDLTKYIYGVETGLSSDPIMNWQIEELESRSILSFSDAHSSPKLGREATILGPAKEAKFELKDLRFEDLFLAFKKDPKGKLQIVCTVEFFPEHGKYHWSGHRNCGIKYSLAQTKEKGFLCPVCHKQLVIGVEKRVADLSKNELADKDLTYLKNKVGTTFVYNKKTKRPPFVSAVPLLEILEEAESLSYKKLAERYETLINNIGTEFDILLKKSFDEIARGGSVKLAEAISIMRERRVYVDPGYDGVFGVVKIFNQDVKEATQKEQTALF